MHRKANSTKKNRKRVINITASILLQREKRKMNRKSLLPNLSALDLKTHETSRNRSKIAILISMHTLKNSFFYSKAALTEMYLC